MIVWQCRTQRYYKDALPLLTCYDSFTWGSGFFSAAGWGVADTKAASANKSTSEWSLSKEVDLSAGTDTGTSKKSPMRSWPKRSTCWLPEDGSVKRQRQFRNNMTCELTELIFH